MIAPPRSVLHVLPHPGGGGQTYLSALAGMEGWRAGRLCLTAQAQGGNPVGLLFTGLGSVTWQSHVHDLLHVHGEAAAGLCLPGLLLRPSVVTLHGLHLLRRLAGTRRKLAAANLRAIVRAASRTICVSQAEHDDLVEVLGAEAMRRTAVILNGVEPAAVPTPEQKAAARAELGVSAQAAVAACVGALDDVKDPLTAARALLQAATQGGGLELLFIGTGPLRPALEALAVSQGGGRIHVLGQHGDVRRVLAAADFFVLPSKREGLSFALLEAMALGLAPVVSDAPGNPEAVGDAGIVVRTGDVAGFADAFARLRDAGQRSAFALRARERAARLFSAERMRRETKALYEAVIG